jgi:hypothetical protein
MHFKANFTTLKAHSLTVIRLSTGQFRKQSNVEDIINLMRILTIIKSIYNETEAHYRADN